MKQANINNYNFVKKENCIFIMIMCTLLINHILACIIFLFVYRKMIFYNCHRNVYILAILMFVNTIG